MFDIQKLSSQCTPHDVLRCDSCGGGINDLQLAMIFWDPDRAGSLVLAHKGRCDPDRHSHAYSAELDWFSKPMAALRRLSSMMLLYKWTELEARRLGLIAWAVAETVSGDQSPLEGIDLL